MRYVSISLFAICSALGCSGPYRVGLMDGDEGGVLPSNGGSSAGGAGAGSGSGGGGVAATGGSLAGGLKSECDLPAGDPGALAAPFAAPDVVWQRLSLWLNGAAMEPPSTMPTTTTYDWSGEIAWAAFQQSQLREVAAPAIRRFVTTTFDFEPESAVANDWSNRLAASTEPLQLLYATQWGEHRTGIFGETEWLTRHRRAVSRGVNILHGVFNQMIPPPPPGVSTSIPESNANLTDRERLARHIADPVCNACHSIIDPLGLALEHFDATGSYRALDAGKPVDSSGSYTTAYSGEQFTFQGMEDLGPQLAQSCQARLAFADLNLKRALLDAGILLEGEDITLAHQDDLSRVRQSFIHQHDYATLIKAIAQTNAFLR
ncbi:MAG TPA: DUF1588 domain-containing protein [Polyangiaceae bacterium]|nr:DUF1588 domain-containing protein [Polyangiaceae bacterium]